MVFVKTGVGGSNPGMWYLRSGRWGAGTRMGAKRRGKAGLERGECMERFGIRGILRCVKEASLYRGCGSGCRKLTCHSCLTSSNTGRIEKRGKPRQHLLIETEG